MPIKNFQKERKMKNRFSLRFLMAYNRRQLIRIGRTPFPFEMFPVSCQLRPSNAQRKSGRRGWINYRTTLRILLISCWLPHRVR